MEYFDFRLGLIKKKKKKGERVCTALEGRKIKKIKIWACARMEGDLYYIYIYIMIHYYDDGNGKKKIALFYLFGVYPRQVRDLAKYTIIYFL